MDCNAEHSEKANSPIEVTESGIVIFVDLFKQDISTPLDEISKSFIILKEEFEDNIIFTFEQFSNGLCPISVTEFGIETDSNVLHQENALSPIKVTEFGMETDCNA